MSRTRARYWMYLEDSRPRLSLLNQGRAQQMTIEEFLVAAGFVIVIAVPLLVPYFIQDRREQKRRIGQAVAAGWSNVRQYGAGVTGLWEAHVVRHTRGMRDEDNVPSSTEILAKGLPRILIMQPSSPFAVDNYILRMIGRERPPLMTTSDPVINSTLEIYSASEEKVQRIINDSAVVRGLQASKQLIVGDEGIDLRMNDENFERSWDVVVRVYRALTSSTPAK